MICRKLSQKRHWDNASWLEPQDVQADATKCLTTSQNRLSIFVLNAPGDQTERVIAALAMARDNLAHLDLAIAPEEVLDRCRIRRCGVQGQTPDSRVNNWHEDLIELTITKIVQLAIAIKNDGVIRRYSPKNVEAAIRRSLEADYIDTERINRNMIQSLRKRGILRHPLDLES